MAIRGANPIWDMVDLVGLQMDDTYYLWVLENDIPYIPSSSIWHDADETIVWSNPIQVLANGTMPIDMFFSTNMLYRLEWRKNDGLLPPSQADQLIYLVENYSPGSSEGSNITAIALSTDNQITNPQFSLINFTSPLTLTSVTDQTISVAPGWDLVLPGTGNVTLTQVPLNSAIGNANPTNAPYALQVQLSGTWSEGEVYLRQRFNQNGMLWAGQYVSASVTAKWISGSSRSLLGVMFDSNGELIDVLDTTSLSTNFIEVTGNGLMPATTNTTFPPAAYVEYRLYIPATVNIQLTSFQLVVANQPLVFSYEQDTIQRQIDHTYNTAYPIIPVGAVIDFAGSATPTHYLPCDGASLLITDYPQLFSAIGATWGSVDAAHFNVPNLNDRVTAGTGGSLFGGVIGSTGGSSTHTLSDAEMPYSVPIAGAVFSTQSVQTGVNTNVPGGPGSWASGSDTPFSIVQQTALMKKCIRFE